MLYVFKDESTHSINVSNLDPDTTDMDTLESNSFMVRIPQNQGLEGAHNIVYNVLTSGVSFKDVTRS